MLKTNTILRTDSSQLAVTLLILTWQNAVGHNLQDIRNPGTSGPAVTLLPCVTTFKGEF